MGEFRASTFVSLAHRYWNFAWDPARNARVYGHLTSREGVGSNFRLEVPSSRLARAKSLLDHRALFDDYPEFRRAPSTLETIARFLHGRLDGAEVVVDEDERLGCRIDANGELTVRERVYNLEVHRRALIDPASGLAVARGELARAVDRIAPGFATPAADSAERWGRRLYAALAAELEGVSELEIRLGPDEVLRIRGDAHEDLVPARFVRARRLQAQPEPRREDRHGT